MKHRLEHSQNQEHDLHEETQQHAAKEFQNSDELLRFDAAQTPVPPEIAQRLSKSARELPVADTRPWWKRILDCLKG